ncbi:tropomyosin-2-like [Aricia agestis]|uniref:tropomyosin-2-like n=1 Tax=Aricia agestis TaxID=91739 RepID=UPI001C207482|nr:tropomyosin-2-like [Aricia agestis]
MDSTQNLKKFSDEQIKNLVNNLSKCKLEYTNWKEECKKLEETKKKLEIELKEAVELEKSHRYHLLTSREMIGNLQDTVTQLLYLKRDVKKLKEEIGSKDITITSMEKDKENILKQYNHKIDELRSLHENEIEEVKSMHEEKVQQVQNDSETQIAQCNCLIEELRAKMNDMEVEHKEKMNILVLEYEEKVQRSAAQVVHLQEQLEHQASRTDANIDAYRRKLKDLEDKLKQSQFKEYLAQSSYPSYENRVERPYSETREYSEPETIVLQSPSDRNRLYDKQKKATPMYRENKPKVDKKGPFNITKKRKLYTDKDFMN